MRTTARLVSGLIRQYYAQRGAWPKFILLPAEAEDAEALSQLFTEQAGHKVSVETPKRGDRLRLVESAVTNAREEAERAATGAQKTLKTLEWLQRTLDLPDMPERIEAFDVSNLGSEGIVAAMTVFVHGRAAQTRLPQVQDEGPRRPRTTTPPCARPWAGGSGGCLDGRPQVLPSCRTCC